MSAGGLRKATTLRRAQDSLRAVLQDVARERGRQIAKWGTPADPFDNADRPDGTGQPGDEATRDLAQHATDMAASAGAVTWRHILAEEVAEAYAETDPELLRTELVQVAAVAVKWVQAIDGRTDQ